MDEPGAPAPGGPSATCCPGPLPSAARTAGALVRSYAAAPRLTRLVRGGLSAPTGAGRLHRAWAWTQQAAEE